MHWILIPALVATSIGFLVFGFRVGASEIKALTRRYRAEQAEEDLAMANRNKADIEADLAKEKRAHKAAVDKAAKDRAELLKKLDDAYKAHGVEVETMRQDAQVKARTYTEALATANRGRAEALTELRALRQCLAVIQKQAGSADERAETAETYLGN